MHWKEPRQIKSNLFCYKQPCVEMNHPSLHWNNCMCCLRLLSCFLWRFSGPHSAKASCSCLLCSAMQTVGLGFISVCAWADEKCKSLGYRAEGFQLEMPPSYLRKMICLLQTCLICSCFCRIEHFQHVAQQWGMPLLFEVCLQAPQIRNFLVPEKVT